MKNRPHEPNGFHSLVILFVLALIVSECVITDAAALAARVLQCFELREAQIGAGKSVMELIARCTAVNIFPWVTVPETDSPSLRIVKLGLFSR